MAQALCHQAFSLLSANPWYVSLILVHPFRNVQRHVRLGHYLIYLIKFNLNHSPAGTNFLSADFFSMAHCFLILQLLSDLTATCYHNDIFFFFFFLLLFISHYSWFKAVG